MGSIDSAYPGSPWKGIQKAGAPQLPTQEEVFSRLRRRDKLRKTRSKILGKGGGGGSDEGGGKTKTKTKIKFKHVDDDADDGTPTPPGNTPAPAGNTPTPTPPGNTPVPVKATARTRSDGADLLAKRQIERGKSLGTDVPEDQQTLAGRHRQQKTASRTPVDTDKPRGAKKTNISPDYSAKGWAGVGEGLATPTRMSGVTPAQKRAGTRATSGLTQVNGGRGVMWFDRNNPRESIVTPVPGQGMVSAAQVAPSGLQGKGRGYMPLSKPQSGASRSRPAPVFFHPPPSTSSEPNEQKFRAL